MSALVLSIDSATDRPTLALGTAEKPGADRVIPHRHDLSRDIDRVARALLSGAGPLGGVLVADGPGSFTGLRIGIAFAKGICRALGVPLYTAPSMMGAAWKVARPRTPHSAPRSPVVVDYDALRGDVYRATYGFEQAKVQVLIAPALARRSDAVPTDTLRATADDASAASLLALMLHGGVTRLDDPGAWQPAYGRPAEAEARRLARRAD